MYLYPKEVAITTTEIIERLQSDPVLAAEVMSGMPDREKYAFSCFYGIGCNPSTAEMIEAMLGLSNRRVYQLITRATVWLRHPMRIHIIQKYLQKQQRQRAWYYRFLKLGALHGRKIKKVMLKCKQIILKSFESI